MAKKFVVPKAPIAIGESFSRLTVIEPSLHWQGQFKVKCRCQCGQIIEVTQQHLRSGNTKSCGCLRRDTIRSIRKRHGKSNTPIYNAYLAMIARCNNPSSHAYANYGARGIRVCDRWLGENGFPSFLSDMGDRPHGKSIDRINNDGNYEPLNCRWASRLVQNNNARSNRILSFDGKSMTISQWTELLGLGRTTIACRLNRGWSVDATLSTPKLR